jgi:outer membrane protein
VNLRLTVVPLLVAASGWAQTAPNTAAPAPSAGQTGGPSKIAIIAFQSAVLSTQEGQQAQAAMKSKFDPRKAQLEKRQADLQAMQERLQKGGPTLTAEARSRLESDVNSGTRSLNNAAEDLNNDVQEEEGKVLQGMAAKMGDIIKNYATKNGYTVVLDVSSQQTPVLWATPTVNITSDIVKLYDQAHPVSGAVKAPAAPPAAAPKPPASKKQ